MNSLSGQATQVAAFDECFTRSEVFETKIALSVIVTIQENTETRRRFPRQANQWTDFDAFSFVRRKKSSSGAFVKLIFEVRKNTFTNRSLSSCHIFIYFGKIK